MKQYIFPSGSTDIDALTLQETPVPVPDKKEVLVHIKAVSLNYRDLLVATANHSAPIVPVSDGAGEVVAVGEEVTNLKPGDKVIGLMMPDWQTGEPTERYREFARGGTQRPGVLSEYVSGEESGFVRFPAGLSFAEASTLPGVGVTAWHALARGKALKEHDTVLVQGTGGVSLFALQLAKARRATVIITSSSDEKLERARALGADHGINYHKTPDWATVVLELTGGKGVDRIIEVGGGATLEQSIRATRLSGAISLVGILAGAQEKINPINIFRRNLDLHGIYTGGREMQERLHEELVRTGIHPVVDREFAWEETVEAYRYLQSGKHFGKIVITL